MAASLAELPRDEADPRPPPDGLAHVDDTMDEGMLDDVPMLDGDADG